MNGEKRRARAKRRRKSMALVKRGVPHTCSKWSIHGTWRSPYTLGEWQSGRKLARRES